MSTCPNCKARITCGCQKRKASDGRQVCSTCISKYEAALKLKDSTSRSNVK